MKLVKKIKKKHLFIAIGLLLVGGLSACGSKEMSGKVTLKVAAWPVQETYQAKFEQYEGYKAQFEEMYPNVKLETDEWNFDLKSYLVRAAGNQLPTVFRTAPTELNTLVNSGYIKDITPYMEKYGYLDKYDNNYSYLYTKDEKCYALVEPDSIYKVGMVYNNDLFKQAGLVDENGIPKFPQTWDEVTETAVKIKAATGKPGYVIATNGRHGGWHFINIARSFGVEFLKQDGEKWTATFASPECAKALQWVKDLKWKYNVLQDNLLVNNSEIGKLVGSGEAAMGMEDSSGVTAYPKKYGTGNTVISMSRIPAGPEGRRALSSGTIWVFNNKATVEEIEAAFNWFNLIGYGPEINDNILSRWDEQYKVAAQDRFVGIAPVSIWNSEEITSKKMDVIKKHANIDEKYFVDYASNEDVTYAFDPEKCAQELYDVLDSAIQKVLTDKNADVNKVLSEAQNNFQLNFLNKQ